MTRWRHHVRRARFGATALVAVVLITTAACVGLVQLLLPLATHYPAFVASQLSARLHRPVTFKAIESEWQPSGPLLTVTDLTLGPAQAGGRPVTLPHAALKFDFGAWLRPAHRWITLRLNDMELRVEHSASGWTVVGFARREDQSHAALQSLPVDLDLRNLRVDIVDAVTQRSWKLYAPRLSMVNVGDSVRFGGSVQQLGTRQSITVNGSLDSARRDYSLHALTDRLDLAEAVRGLGLQGYVLARGSADIELWGRWVGGQLASASARYSVRGLVASGPGGRDIDLDALAGVVAARRVAGGWNIAWRGPGKPRADIDDAGGALIQLRGARGAWRVSAAARDVDASPWLALLAMAPEAPAGLVDWIVHARPHGHIESAALVWRDATHFDAAARFADLHAAPSGAIPGIVLARGSLRADPQAVAVELPGGPASLALTHVFRRPFAFKDLSGTLVAWRDAGRWTLATAPLRFDTGSIRGSARARLVLPGHGESPFLEAYASVEHAQATDAKLFWPWRTMPPALVEWLDHAFVAGKVSDGRVVVRGSLADWPFLAHQGRFEASGLVHDAVFDYAPGWPRASAIDAAVDFVDNRMGIVATHVDVQGVVATHAVAQIPDLANGVLGLDIRGHGAGGDLLDFVRHSPVGAGATEALQGLTLGGSGNFGIKLSIPLADAEKFTLDGKLDLANADVSADKWKLRLRNLGGSFLIHDRGFRAPALTAGFRGAPAKLALAVGSGVTDAGNIVEGGLDATLSAQTLAQGFPDLDGIVAHARGSAPFHVGVVVASGRGGANAVPTLTVASTLAGIALDLPAPLDKPAADVLPLAMNLRLPPEGAPLTLSLGDLLQVRGRMADPARGQPMALAVALGTGPPPAVPASGMLVQGSAHRLDLGGWVEQALGTAPGGAFPALAHADVAIDAAEIFGTNLGPLHFVLAGRALADTITLDGRAVKGTIEVPLAGATEHGITARLARLYWPASAPPPAASPPTSAAAPAVRDASSALAPAAIPPLQVAVDDLRLGDAHLGATAFVSTPTAKGMHVASFTSKGADFTIAAHGDWTGDAAASRSRMAIDITSNDFGKMLAAFGFGGMVAGGQHTHINIDGSWPGAPSAFSLGEMDGTLVIDVGEGQILAVKPGLGRLLGLLSLRELPSRLLLHFGDVFKTGFGFDHASAKFTFKGGDAYTQDMQIRAPAAQISMQGRTGFRQRDFDMTLHVIPHVGGTLPVVGAVIGGPVGAAAGLVVQGLIGKGINKAAGSTYNVTGSWDKPKIVELESHGPAAGGTTLAPPYTGLSALPASPSSAPVPAAAASD